MDVVSCHSTYYSIDVDATGMGAKMFKTCMSCHEIQPINPLMLIQLGVIEGLWMLCSVIQPISALLLIPWVWGLRC
jgi:hypothetical protein